MEPQDIDTVDVICILGSIIIIAYTTLTAAVLVIPIGLAQYFLRRSQWFENKAAELHGLTAKPIKLLLPPPKTDAQAYTDKTVDLGSLQREERKKLPFYMRVNLPPDETIYVDNAKSTPITLPAITKQTPDMAVLLKKAPAYFSYEKLPDPPTNTSIPVGYDLATKQIMWMDLAKDFVHGLVAGMTGTGKDALLRLWYVYLTSYNSPQDIQFVILDGKNEWMLPALAQSPYMFIAPAGGVDLVQNEKGKWILGSTARMAESLTHVFNEVQRRQELFYNAGATNLKSYELKTGNKLARLVIIATDVGEDFSGDLETLVRILTMKARSFGINLIISMQTSSKQDTGWRSNLSLTMSGYQALQSADQPIMGINATNILYRPSQLPNPEEYDIAKGLFSVRKGSYQTIVKTPHLPEDVFEQYIHKAIKQPSADELLIQRAKEKYGKRITQQLSIITPLDFIQQDIATARNINTTTSHKHEWSLTKEQRVQVIGWARQGWNKTKIMRDGLKYTSGDYYKHYSADVDKLLSIVDVTRKQ